MDKQDITALCGFYGKSRNGYYRRLSKGERQVMVEDMIVERVLEERRLQPRLGGRKLYHLLQADIHLLSPVFGRDKFFSLLGRQGLLIARKKSFTRTTASNHRFYKYRNLIKEKVLTAPNQVYVSDITYLRTQRGFAYLSLLTDKFSRKIVGWHLSESLSIEGSLAALQMALQGCPDPHLLTHHSDRGIQYCSYPYTGLLQQQGVQISMTQENHCYENALAERVNGILKDEYNLDTCFADFTEAKRACAEAISLYNIRRPHCALKMQTPEEVHQKVA